MASLGSGRGGRANVSENRANKTRRPWGDFSASLKNNGRNDDAGS